MPTLPGVIVDADWLAHHLDAVAVCDVRWYLDGRDGRAAFEAGHLPGALYVDLDTDLSSPHKGGPAGRHPLPDPVDFAHALGRHGIGTDDVVVAYDDSGGGTAGRLVWMLRLLGQEAALLDGGLASWPGELEHGPAVPRLEVFVHARPWPAGELATREELLDTVEHGGTVLDARAPERYRGESEPVDARPGHVPGARNAPWAATLGPDGRFRPVEELRRHFEALGAGDGTIVYCGSGVSACADLLAMQHAGAGTGRLFVPSWSGWSADPDNPVATGPE